MKHDVFISYRRDGGDMTAMYLYRALQERGYNVFYDLEVLRNGKFNDRIRDSIKECKDFLLILSPHCLDRCVNEDDWVRLEIEEALKQKKNIIPVMMNGFRFPDTLPASIDEIRYHNALVSSTEYFTESVDRLCKRYMSAKPTALKKKKSMAVIVIAAVFIVAAVVGVLVGRSTRNMAIETAEPMTEEPAASVTEEMAEPVPEETAAPVTEEMAEPVPEETAAPVTEEMAEPVPEETAEPVPEETAAPVSEEPPTQYKTHPIELSVHYEPELGDTYINGLGTLHGDGNEVDCILICTGYAVNMSGKDLMDSIEVLDVSWCDFRGTYSKIGNWDEFQIYKNLVSRNTPSYFMECADVTGGYYDELVSLYVILPDDPKLTGDQWIRIKVKDEIITEHFVVEYVGDFRRTKGLKFVSADSGIVYEAIEEQA